MNSFKELFENARKRPSYQIAKEKLETQLKARNSLWKGKFVKNMSKDELILALYELNLLFEEKLKCGGKLMNGGL